MSRDQDRQRKKALDAEVVDYINEKAKVLGETNKARKNDQVAALLAKDTLFFQQLQGALGKIFAGKLPAPKPSFKKKGPTNRILNLILSDLHIGSDLIEAEIGHPFGVVEEARRLASICKQASDYKRDYRDQTELKIHLLGDLICGDLGHDPRDGAPLAEQISRAIYLLLQGIVYLAQEFPKVSIHCATGNHERRVERHPNRAVQQKHDSWATVIYFSLKQALRAYKNVAIEIPVTPYYVFDCFGKKSFATHGDNNLRAPFAGKSINTGSLMQQLNVLNSAASKKGIRYGMAITGHVHTGSLVFLPNGVVMITNGALIPVDAYAQSIGIYETVCGQWLIESTPDYLCGDSRFAIVDEKTDKDKNLENIIKPFNGY